MMRSTIAANLFGSRAFGKAVRIGRSAVAALNDLRVDRDATQERDVHFTGQRLAAALLEQRQSGRRNVGRPVRSCSR